ncbi:MAG: exodeoxyribonuclease VII small subunit [Anaerolineaceae bacterium]
MTAPVPVESLTYEQAFQEMESIIAALENNPSSLEEAMHLYERGQALSVHCSELLDKAELKIQQLFGDTLSAVPEQE